MSDDIDKQQIRKISSHKHYDVWEEKWLTYWEDEPQGHTMDVIVARNKNGDNIGEKKMAEMLAGHGIAPEMADLEHDVCCIGWSERHQKYFGWSHRAIVGFGIGDKVFEEEFGDDQTPFISHGSETIEAKSDARRAAINFAEHIG